jgi:hypothetical protein
VRVIPQLGVVDMASAGTITAGLLLAVAAQAVLAGDSTLPATAITYAVHITGYAALAASPRLVTRAFDQGDPEVRRVNPPYPPNARMSSRVA